MRPGQLDDTTGAVWSMFFFLFFNIAVCGHSIHPLGKLIPAYKTQNRIAAWIRKSYQILNAQSVVIFGRTIPLKSFQTQFVWTGLFVHTCYNNKHFSPDCCHNVKSMLKDLHAVVLDKNESTLHCN